MRGTSVSFLATELRTRPRLEFHFAAQHHISCDRERELDSSFDTKQSFQRLTNSQKIGQFFVQCIKFTRYSAYMRQFCVVRPCKLKSRHSYGPNDQTICDRLVRIFIDAQLIGWDQSTVVRSCRELRHLRIFDCELNVRAHERLSDLRTYRISAHPYLRGFREPFPFDLRVYDVCLIKSLSAE